MPDNTSNVVNAAVTAPKVPEGVVHIASIAIMYVAGNTEHGIRNTGTVPMTFYFSKWLAK